MSCKVRNQSEELVRRHFSQLFKELPSESALRGKGGKNRIAVRSLPILPEVESDLSCWSRRPWCREDIPEPRVAANQEEKPLGVQPLRSSTRVHKSVERLITTM